MSPREEFQETALALRQHTTTLENLRGQLFDGSYRQGSLLCFRAMVVEKELRTDFDENKFKDFQKQVTEIEGFIKNIIVSPDIFGSFYQ